jgi:hypothetical protein
VPGLTLVVLYMLYIMVLEIRLRYFNRPPAIREQAS